MSFITLEECLSNLGHKLKAALLKNVNVYTIEHQYLNCWQEYTTVQRYFIKVLIELLSFNKISILE